MSEKDRFLAEQIHALKEEEARLIEKMQVQLENHESEKAIMENQIAASEEKQKLLLEEIEELKEELQRQFQKGHELQTLISEIKQKNS